jgi:hypothetical protein
MGEGRKWVSRAVIPGRRHSASKTRVNALAGAPRNDACIRVTPS